MDDMRPDERVETADFAPAQVGGRGPRRLGPLVAGAWVVALMAVVGVGIVGQAGPPAEPSGVPRQLPVAVRPLPSTVTQMPAPSGSHAPTRPSDGKPIELEVAPGPAGI